MLLWKELRPPKHSRGVGKALAARDWKCHQENPSLEVVCHRMGRVASLTEEQGLAGTEIRVPHEKSGALLWVFPSSPSQAPEGCLMKFHVP